MNKKIKNLKPTELNVHCKYTCPVCSVEHWLSLAESQTKGFIIVCDCKTMLKPKRISNIEILYDKKSAKTNTQKVVKETTLADLGQCVKILVGYGFKASEAKTIVAEAHASNPTSDTASLIKNILVTIGGKNG